MADATNGDRQEEKGIVTYEINNAKVTLTAAIVRRFFCAEADDMSALTFAGFCRAHSLDPFAHDCFLTIRERDGKPVPQITIAYQMFMRRAEASEHYRGFAAGTILVKTDKATVDLEGEPNVVPKPLVACKGEFVPDGYTIIGGWCVVHRDDRDEPIVATVSLKDYEQRTRAGNVNMMWTGKTATMIRKTGIAHGFRDAFPEVSRFYLREELPGNPEPENGKTDRVVDGEIVGQPGSHPDAPSLVVAPEILALFEALQMNTAGREMFLALHGALPVDEQVKVLKALPPKIKAVADGASKDPATVSERAPLPATATASPAQSLVDF